MHKILSVIVLISAAGCSGMGGMHSGSSGTSSSSPFIQSGANAGGDWSDNKPLTHQPVINPRTGDLNLYHGG